MMSINWATIGKTKSEILQVRQVAVSHLENTRATRDGRQPWLPQIAEAVELALVDVIEELNVRIEQIDQSSTPVQYRGTVQLAFEFLFEYTIKDEEVPW